MKTTKYLAPFPHWVVEHGFPDLRLGGLDLPWEPYHNESEQKKLCRDLGKLPPALRELFEVLLSTDFTMFVQLLTGLVIPGLVADDTLHGGGVHCSEYLGVHIDYALHPKLSPPMERRLNLILFLTPEWDPAWGGALELYDDEGRECVARVYPEPGKMVLWEPTDTAFHATQQVIEGVPPRLTAAVYYVAPARPGCVRKRALFIPRRGSEYNG